MDSVSKTWTQLVKHGLKLNMSSISKTLARSVKHALD